MSILNLQASYFAIDNPLRLLDRWFNRFRHQKSVVINQRNVEVRWTDRAEKKLQLGSRPLIVELQLYFSCVVKKRVVFHQQAPGTGNGSAYGPQNCRNRLSAGQMGRPFPLLKHYLYPVFRRPGKAVTL
jgi:hypothetical protein